MSHPPKRSLVDKLSSRALYVILIVLGLLLGFMTFLAAPRPTGEIKVPVPADSATAPIASVAAIDILDSLGRRRPMPPMAGGVIVVISVTCPHCRDLLSEFAENIAENPSYRLTVLALEGIEAGRAHLIELGLKADLIAPAEPVSQFARKLGIRSTPTLLDVAPTGEVRGYEVGSSRQARAQWRELMLRPAAVP